MFHLGKKKKKESWEEEHYYPLLDECIFTPFKVDLVILSSSIVFVKCVY